jgi:hypothetical protein
VTDGDREISDQFVPLPVDDMVHFVLAQHTVMVHIERDLRVRFPHGTALEDFPYSRRCDADAQHATAGWAEQLLRY